MVASATRTSMTPDEYLDRVRALLPALRELAPQAEQLRRLPEETFSDFQEQGLLRALQPKRYGGFELDPGTFYRAVFEVGAVCGSSGWILGVLGVHNWHLAILPPQAQEDVWGEDAFDLDNIDCRRPCAPGPGPSARPCFIWQRLVGIAAVGWCLESRYLIDTTTTRLARRRTP